MPCADPFPGCCGAHRRNGEDYIVSVAGTYKLIHYYDTFFCLGSKPTHSIVFAYFYGAKPTLTPRLVDLSNFFQQFAHMQKDASCGCAFCYLLFSVTDQKCRNADHHNDVGYHTDNIQNRPIEHTEQHRVDQERNFQGAFIVFKEIHCQGIL